MPGAAGLGSPWPANSEPSGKCCSGRSGGRKLTHGKEADSYLYFKERP